MLTRFVSLSLFFGFLWVAKASEGEVFPYYSMHNFEFDNITATTVIVVVFGRV